MVMILRSVLCLVFWVGFGKGSDFPATMMKFAVEQAKSKSQLEWLKLRR